jgi:hypothetical protein
MKFPKISNKLGNFFALLILFIVIIEIIRIFILDIPQYRYLQLLWHIQHNNTIKIANCQLELPINWTIKEEIKDQYVLQADLRKNGTLQTAILYKSLPLNAERTLAKTCALEDYMNKEYFVKHNKISMAWCRKLDDNGSLAIFRNTNKKIALVVYDYIPSDYANIKLLLQTINCKVQSFHKVNQK